MTALPESVEPSLAPGGLVLVQYVDGVAALVQKLTVEQCLEPGALEASADYAIEQVDRWVGEGCEVIMRAYDGDSGCTLLTVPTGEARRIVRFWLG